MSEESGAGPPDSGDSQDQDLEGKSIIEWNPDDVRQWLLRSRISDDVANGFRNMDGQDLANMDTVQLLLLIPDEIERARLFKRVSSLLRTQKGRNRLTEVQYNVIMEERGTPVQSAAPANDAAGMKDVVKAAVREEFEDARRKIEFRSISCVSFKFANDVMKNYCLASEVWEDDSQAIQFEPIDWGQRETRKKINEDAATDDARASIQKVLEQHDLSDLYLAKDASREILFERIRFTENLGVTGKTDIIIVPKKAREPYQVHLRVIYDLKTPEGYRNSRPQQIIEQLAADATSNHPVLTIFSDHYSQARVCVVENNQIRITDTVEVGKALAMMCSFLQTADASTRFRLPDQVEGDEPLAKRFKASIAIKEKLVVSEMLENELDLLQFEKDPAIQRGELVRSLTTHMPYLFPRMTPQVRAMYA